MAVYIEISMVVWICGMFRWDRVIVGLGEFGVCEVG